MRAVWPLDKRPLRGQVSFALRLFAIAAVLRVASFLAFYLGSLLTGNGGGVDPYDPVGIDRWAWYAAQHFARGQLVNLADSHLEGTWNTGFTYFVALQYTVFGHHPEIPRFVNAMLAAFCAPAAYLTARATPLGEVVARRAGWLVAVWPLSIYWAGYDLLKDPMTWFLLSLAMLAVVSRSTLRFVLLSAAATAPMLVVRIYVGAALYLFLPLCAALQHRWRTLAATVAMLVIVEAALLGAGYPALWSSSYLGEAQVLIQQTTTPPPIGNNSSPGSTIGHGTPPSVPTKATDCSPRTILSNLFACSPLQAGQRLVVGFLINVFGPRPALADILHPTLDTGMYPGLLAWILLIPLTLLGFWRAIRLRDPRIIALAALSAGLWFEISFLVSSGGFRQREMAFPVTLIFTSLGLERPLPQHWRWIYGGYLGVGAAVLIARQLGVF